MGILQFESSTIEGSVWFIVVISIIAAIGFSILKFVIGRAVEFFVIKKSENEDQVKQEVSKVSIFILVIISAVILIWQKDSIADFLNRTSEELVFVGFMLFLLVILVAGVIYREPSKNLRDKLRRNKG